MIFTIFKIDVKPRKDFLEGSVGPPAEYLKSSGGGHIPWPDIFFASLLPHLEHFVFGLVPLFIQFCVCNINSGIVSERENNKALKTFLIENTDGLYSLVPNFLVAKFPVPNFLKLSFVPQFFVLFITFTFWFSVQKYYCSLAFIGLSTSTTMKMMMMTTINRCHNTLCKCTPGLFNQPLLTQSATGSRRRFLSD